MPSLTLRVSRSLVSDGVRAPRGVYISRNVNQSEALRQQAIPSEERPQQREQAYQSHEQGPFDQADTSLKTGRHGSILPDALQELDAPADGRMLPRLEPSGPISADPIQQGHLFE